MSPEVPTDVSVQEVLDYLDALSAESARLPSYFPAHFRGEEAGRGRFDAVRPTVQVLGVRALCDHRHAEERERGRRAGVADDLHDAASASDGWDEPLVEGSCERQTAPLKVPWDEHVAAQFPRAIVLGDPGLGKTWLLRHEARRLAVNAARLLRSGAGTPEMITLPLPARLSDINGTDGPLEAELAETAGSGRSGAFHSFVLRQLEAGLAAVLLDAWDEVPVEVTEPVHLNSATSGHRGRLGARIEAFARRHLRCGLLLTSRLSGYRGLQIPGASELELCAFDWAQIETFARAWCDDAEPFLAWLQQNPRLLRLARIPLMLTLIARADFQRRQQTGELDERADALSRRVPIYRLCLCTLLRDGRENTQPGASSVNYAEAILDVLAQPAYALFASDHEQFGEELLRKELRAALRGMGEEHELSGRDATSVIFECMQSAILLSAGNQPHAPLSFLHHSFHEYLAARALARRVNAEGWDAIADLVDRKSWRPGWHEVIVLLAGQLADPTPLLRLLAERGRDDLFRHRLALAALCLAEIAAENHDPSLVNKIATEAVDIWVRHRRAGTEAAVRHLTFALPALGTTMAGLTDGTRSGAVILKGGRSVNPRQRQAADDTSGRRIVAAAPALGRLLNWSRANDYDMRSAAVEALYRLAPAGPALAHLLSGIRNAPREVSQATIEALPALGPAAAQALDRLVELIRDPRPGLRSNIVEALAALGPAAAPALDSLLELTRDRDEDVQLTAVKALGAVGPPAAPALDRLLEMIKGADYRLRRELAGALAGLGRAAAPAADALLELSRDRYGHVRSGAVRALGALGHTSALALDRLLEMTNDDDEGIRRQIASELFGLAPASSRAMQGLLHLSRDTNPGVRRAIIAMLGRLAVGPTAVSALKRLQEVSRDADSSIRADAVKALGELGPAAAPALDRILELTWDADNSVRLSAVAALGGLGTAAAPALDRLLNVLQEACKAAPMSSMMLGRRRGISFDIRDPQVGREEALAVLASGAGLDLLRMGLVRQAAASALGGLGPAAVPALDRLVELSRDADSTTRSVAVRALGRLGPAAAGAIDRLLELTRDADHLVRWAAVSALGALGSAGEPALARILELTRDSHPIVRRAAIRALHRLGRGTAPVVDRLVELTSPGVNHKIMFMAVRLLFLRVAGRDLEVEAPPIFRESDLFLRTDAAEALGHIMANGVRILAPRRWKWFSRPTGLTDLDKLDPEKPAIS
jgi:HEAT repeat protein